jgi:SAM-dependent methyltransferase
MKYDAPTAYAELIGPRYAPVAKALVEAARLRPTDDVLELGAGTGIVTKLAAPQVRSLLATDTAPEMLEVARRSTGRYRHVSFALVDYEQPLPFLDGSFDVVLSGLTYVQEWNAAVKELARVLKPQGRIALSMWGPDYHELTLLSDALESIGRPRIPAAVAPARDAAAAARRLRSSRAQRPRPHEQVRLRGRTHRVPPRLRQTGERVARVLRAVHRRRPAACGAGRRRGRPLRARLDSECHHCLAGTLEPRG